MAEKIYFNGAFLKETQYGIKLSGKAADIIAEIQKHTKANGTIRLEIQKRREADKNGNTHYITVDTWEPSNAGEGRSKPGTNEDNTLGPADDLPF